MRAQTNNLQQVDTLGHHTLQLGADCNGGIEVHDSVHDACGIGVSGNEECHDTVMILALHDLRHAPCGSPPSPSPSSGRLWTGSCLGGCSRVAH